jgi:hypothetical protein
MVGTDTFATKDTLTEVPYNERICLLKTRIMGHRVKIYKPNSQIGCDSSQFASIPLVANNAGFGMIGYHKTDNVFPVLFDGGGVCQ